MSIKNKLIVMGSILIAIILLAVIYLSIPKGIIKLNGEKKMTVNYGENYTDEGAIGYYSRFFKTKKIKVNKLGDVDTKKLGKYTIIYKLDYKKLHREAVREVNVVDTEKPNLTIISPIQICKNNGMVKIDAKAIDNYDGDISDKIHYRIDKQNVYLLVSDSSNNTLEVIQPINYADGEKPTIKLKGASNVFVSVGSTYTELGAEAYDSCDGDLTKEIKTSGIVDTSKEGTYEIIYTVKDSLNNEVSTKRIVHVTNDELSNTNVTEGSIIYLTFDDGPGPYTEQILDILKENDIKATFFVTNQFGSKYQYIIKKEYEEGHTVGIHTYSHKWSIYDSLDSYLDDFERIREIVVRETGVEPKYFRFPGGTSNHVAKISMANLSKLMTEKGYIYFDWSLSVEDAGSCTKKKNSADKEKCEINYFKEGLNKNHYYNVVLMHDIKKSTLDALPEMISYAKSKGYIFKAIDDTTPLKQFTPYK